MNNFEKYGFVNEKLRGGILEKVQEFYVGHIIENTTNIFSNNIIAVTWNEFGEAFIGNRPKSKYNLIKIEEA